MGTGRKVWEDNSGTCVKCVVACDLNCVKCVVDCDLNCVKCVVACDLNCVKCVSGGHGRKVWEDTGHTAEYMETMCWTKLPKAHSLHIICLSTVSNVL